MMKTRRTGTLCSKKDVGGVMRRSVALLAVLLLACVLMAGAVSAEEETVEVETYADLIAKLADEATTSIKLTADITATAEINVNKSVTIDGAGHKITADFSGAHLLEIVKKSSGVVVTLKNLNLDGASKAKGLNIFEPGDTITLTDLTLTNSAGSDRYCLRSYDFRQHMETEY